MSALNKIWSGVAIFLLVFSVNTLGVVQWKQSSILQSIITISGDNASDSALLIGIPIMVSSLFILIYLAKISYKISIRHTQTQYYWKDRVPKFLDLDVPEELSENWALLSLFLIILPYLINIQQFYKFISDGPKAVLKNGAEVSIWKLEWPSIIFTDRFRYGHVDGFTFWPFYMPTIYGIMEIILFTYIFIYLQKLFRGR